jgi:serine protease Do
MSLLTRSCLIATLAATALLPTHVKAEPPEAVNLRRTVTVEVVAKTKAAVVNISSTRLVQQRVFADPFGAFDRGIRLIPSNSLGSGFIIHDAGYVVTNHHVIDKARQITVELNDGRKLPADLISSDPEADLAVLKIREGGPFPTLDLGDSADLLIGEPVIAVGNPLGFSHSVSTGIVSAVHRNLTDNGGQNTLLADLIQTDAAINPGNSGGPLLNAYGQVIGINTAIRGDAQNIGFAIQVNTLRNLLPELLRPGQVTRVDVPLTLSEKRTSTPPANVAAEVLARANGTGDAMRVTAIDGKPVKTIVDASVALLAAKADQPLKVTLDGGRTVSVKPTATPLPNAVVQAKERLGITIEPLTPQLAERMGLGIDTGLLVTAVARGSAADRAGVQAGDVLLQFGRFRTETLDEFGALLGQLPAQFTVRIVVARQNQVGTLVLRV